jgi:predicted SprT family Zn-dependent metalloprotease
MTEQQLNNELNILCNQASELGYKIVKPTLFIDPVYGNKLAYYQHGSNKIVMHDHFVENASTEEVMQTLKHELAHALAEQNNTTDKRVWHGQAWKDILSAIGGSPDRFHQGAYKKPEHKKVSMKDLYSVLPKHPADRWERGTYKQWLTRGYHVIKGQKGSLAVWEFVADEYELADQDGKTSNYGRASAVYFTPDQVEPNTKKVVA